MAFFVPESYENFYDETIQRFKLLLQKQVLTGIDFGNLDQWLSNFQNKEEKYLAAHLLNSLIYRSGHMLCSSFQHLMHSELPVFLHRNGFQTPQGLVAFHRQLQEAEQDCAIRFVAVDGEFEQAPGKSGSVIIRKFAQHLNISKKILCRPGNVAALPEHVKFLIFVDDMLGTGTQFGKFAKFYKLDELRARFAMAYSPQLSHAQGIAHVAKHYPWLNLLPIERMGPEHQFFRAKGLDGLWHGDAANKVEDVKDFCDALSQRNEIPKRTRHSLDLAVLFEHAAPNNTLPLYWAKSNHWHPLIAR
ncbi:phosphoribosyltransferase-like protein [Burkholderia sp. LMG 21824]|uniref:phosphoribosyltransferase-like protein n=1 Tax=Burkholderia sp. LMG 21824 TaxID=3158172 RepID=UPI003C2CF0F1